MSRLNILNKQGLLSTEDRKEPLFHQCDYLSFSSCLDLSDPIKVSYGIPNGRVSLQNYTRSVASFFAWWSHFVHKDLNGFSGMSHLKFELDFEIVP